MEAKLEFAEMLQKYCQTVRRSRSRPDLAIEAGKWEIRLQSEIEEQRREVESKAQPEPAVI